MEKWHTFPLLQTGEWRTARDEGARNRETHLISHERLGDVGTVPLSLGPSPPHGVVVVGERGARSIMYAHCLDFLTKS